MTFLAPALLAALLATAIPVIVHLVQREQRRVQAFPSLMFLSRIQSRAVRRRAIRNWPLLALRVLAFALIALAFARPFLPAPAAAGAGTDRSRDVVILLDRSASMGYGDHWRRAQEAARGVVKGLAPGDAASVVFFDTDVEVAVRSEAGRGALIAAVDRARPGPRGTRFGAALRAAAGLFDATSPSRREVVLISDFQKTGWDAAQDARLPAGTVLTTIPIAESAPTNAALVGLTFERQAGPKGTLVTASARVANYGPRRVVDRGMTLDVDGLRVDAQRLSVEPGSAATVPFAPFALGARGARVTARLAPDALAADDGFHAVVEAGGEVAVLILDSAGAAPDASLYLARALDVSATPRFATRITRVDRATPDEMAAAAVVVLNDARPPAGAAGRALASAVHDGAGLLVVLGERSAWTEGYFDLLPGKLGAAVDRDASRGGVVGSIDLSHPAFEIFSAPRSGDLSAARVFRYRTLEAPPRVLARFDDGGVALAERRVSRGTVIAWTSTLDGRWNDLPLKPVFVPFVHRLITYLGRFAEPRAWYLVGEAFDPAQAPPRLADGRRALTGSFTALSPQGRPVEPMSAGSSRTIPLDETGFYEVRPPGAARDAVVVAVNGLPSESDLSPLDLEELKARVGSPPPGSERAIGHEIGMEERERRQSLWWYVLAAGLLLLTIEAVAANKLPRVA